MKIVIITIAMFALMGTIHASQNWHLTLKDFRVKITEKGEENYECADKPKALIENKKINFEFEVSGYGDYRYEIHISRDGFDRRSKEKDLFKKNFKEKLKGTITLGLPKTISLAGYRLNPEEKTKTVKWKLPPLNPRVHAQHGRLNALLVIMPVGVPDSSPLRVSRQIGYDVYFDNFLERFVQVSDETSCKEVYPAVDITAPYINKNVRDMEISVADANGRSDTEKESKTAGWSFSPIAILYGIGIGFGNFSEAYMREVSRDVSHAITVTVNNFYPSGDHAIIYEQRIRRVQAYTIKKSNYCGEIQELGRLYAQTEDVVKNSEIINPELLSGRVQLGLPPSNNCQKIDAALQNYNYFSDMQDYLKQQGK